MSTGSVNTIGNYIDDLETICELKAEDEPDLTIIHNADFALMKIRLEIIKHLEDIIDRVLKIEPRIKM